MHGVTMAGRKHTPRTIEIAVLRTDYDQAAGRTVIRKFTDGDGVKQAVKVSAPDTETMKRIRQINDMLNSATHYAAKDAPESGGTKLTTIRVEQNPIATLLARKKIGGEELMAAQDIELAVMAIAGASMFKPLTMEKSDRSHIAKDWPKTTADAVERYQHFANHWSKRKKQSGDPMLEVVYSAVVDQWTMRTIGSDLGYHHSKIERAVICGLRDYAARAGWLERRAAQAALDAAAGMFKQMRVA